MLNKSEDDLIKLDRKIELMLKNSNFGLESAYWRNIKNKIRGKLYEMRLVIYYEQYKADHLDEIEKLQHKEEA